MCDRPNSMVSELQQALVAADRQLPIVFVTGHRDIPMRVRAMKAGAMLFLLKSFNDEKLLKKEPKLVPTL
jgi:FixJ family two-component response regulator